MKSPDLRSNLLRVLFLVLCLSCADAATENVLHVFDPAPGGASPVAGLIADAAGNLYGTTSFGHNLGVVFELSPGTNGKWTETVLYSFKGNPTGAYQDAPVDGAYPEGDLVFDSAGNLYGTTSSGGFYNLGTVFELTPTSSGWREKVLYFFGTENFFAPTGGLTIDQKGNLYGAVSSGNPNGFDNCYGRNFQGCGAIFELSPNGDGTWTENYIYIFTGSPDGSTPRSRLIFDAKGNLYGTTEYGGSSSGICQGDNLLGCGTVFELSPNKDGTWSENVLYYFTGREDGTNPVGGLVFDQQGNLYGTTYGIYAGEGSVFRLSHGTWDETTLYRFARTQDGRHPNGAVILDAAGHLYGTTEYGGSGHCRGMCGTVYELTRTRQQRTWTEKIIYEFTGKQDGSHPAGDVFLDSSGNLYMTGSSGGHDGCDHGCGSVFELTPGSGGNWTGKAIFDLPFHEDGGFSYAGLISDSSGNLYGTTEYGGNLACNYPLGCGTVFELTPSRSGELVVKVLHEFNNAKGDGAFPVAGLVSDPSGNLYGTTQYGGQSGCQSSNGQCGIVFELSQASDGSWKERVIYYFGSPGFGPVAGLIRDQTGNLYGTTEFGGTGCQSGVCGTVFELSPRSGGGWKVSTLYNFGSQQGDGVWPVATLVFDNKGSLYGTTNEGGLGGYGTVFQLNPNTDLSWTEKVIYSFADGYDGAYPLAGLVVDQKGALYGTTYQGGEYESGVVFKLSAGMGGSWSEDVIHQFIGVNGDGAYPQAGLVFDSVGNLYGTTTIGGINNGGCGHLNGCGIAFELVPKRGTWEEKILHRFTGGRDGGEPFAGLLLDSQGNVYGTTSSGGAGGAGLVFELKP